MGGRGRRHPRELRQTIISLVKEAVTAGARQREACRIMNVSQRTLQRWQSERALKDDARRGPKTPVAHQLTQTEKEKIVALANSEPYRNLSPEAVVAKLATTGVYICSERSLRRILAKRKQLTYRGRTKPAAPNPKPRAHVAERPLQVLSWDITYLRNAQIRGSYFFLYLYVDVWSRRILGWAVHEEQSSTHASALLRRICQEHGIEADTAVLHQDNGAPMKGATFIATMEALGIAKSFSRPGVSDDNAYIESLFRHLKYAPSYPRKGFHSIVEARSWIERFTDWYNNRHLHSAIGYVTPDDRHHGRDIALLAQRRAVYRAAKERHPRRWTRNTRQWKRPSIVTLNPERVVETQKPNRKLAA